ncbi:MAG: hypothetical protein WC244_01560 [Patescibacteria group bacterium]|jgi:hypothetical protein
MTKLSEKIVKEIKDKTLKPTPLWKFRIKESGRWLSVIALVIFVGFIASMIWLFTSGIDIGLSAWLSGRPFFSGRALALLLVILIFGAVAILLDIRKTKHGYKYKSIIILILIVVIGLFLASVFAWSGLPGRLDKSLSGAPLYQTSEQYMISVWQQPSEGRLIGEIVSVGNGGDFTLRDFNNQEWQIIASQAVWRHNLEAQVGLKIKVSGTLGNGNIFEATDIRPYSPSGGSCGQIQSNSINKQKGCRMGN